MKKPIANNENVAAIRPKYEAYGVQGFYEQFGEGYRNPHEEIINKLLQEALATWELDLTKVLDLACGSGEITLALRKIGHIDINAIEGIDPYTYAAYEKRTGQVAERFTFEEIAASVLLGRNYSLIVCSFALHLVEESWLPLLCYQLGLISDSLIVITPHKRPQLKAEWGWNEAGEIIVERVRARLYRHN
jgi:hypothetical protein